MSKTRRDIGSDKDKDSCPVPFRKSLNIINEIKGVKQFLTDKYVPRNFCIKYVF